MDHLDWDRIRCRADLIKYLFQGDSILVSDVIAHPLPMVSSSYHSFDTVPTLKVSSPPKKTWGNLSTNIMRDSNTILSSPPPTNRPLKALTIRTKTDKWVQRRGHIRSGSHRTIGESSPSTFAPWISSAGDWCSTNSFKTSAPLTTILSKSTSLTHQGIATLKNSLAVSISCRYLPPICRLHLESSNMNSGETNQ